MLLTSSQLRNVYAYVIVLVKDTDIYCVFSEINMNMTGSQYCSLFERKPSNSKM